MLEFVCLSGPLCCSHHAPFAFVDCVEPRMDPERAAEFQQDLLDQDKLKDMTAADGTLPGGTVPHLT